MTGALIRLKHDPPTPNTNYVKIFAEPLPKPTLEHDNIQYLIGGRGCFKALAARVVYSVHADSKFPSFKVLLL